MQKVALLQRMPYGEEMATLFIPDEVVPEGSEEEAQKPKSLATARKTRSTVMGDVRYLNQRNSVPSYRRKKIMQLPIKSANNMKRDYNTSNKREKKMLKEKNIVAEIKGSGFSASQLSIFPIITYDRFQIGANIKNYNLLVTKTYEGDDKYTLDEYSSCVSGYQIILCCKKNGTLDSICFKEHCFYKGADLIGMSIFDFMIMMRKEPDSVSIDWVPIKDENHGQNQRCYCFYFHKTRVMQLWTWRKKIVSISVYDYNS